MVKLQTIEQMTEEYCQAMHIFINSGAFDLSYADIPATSEMLVLLYGINRNLDKLATLNRRHEVIDNNTGKSLGYLYDDEHIEGLMMSINIEVGAKIRSCEWHIGYLTRQMIIKN